ncbi:hypothetical protein DL96DRAFT_1581177 [Flagelloscypha sp. PMI_526]|nr:hypothetical protein DL96DRAFT_1581177 [Flagelloscypha sp. PMI_526]
MGLRRSVVHLSLGTHLYETAVRQNPMVTEALIFGLFDRLHSITFTAPVDASPGGWSSWWTYISDGLDYPLDMDPLIPLKTMRMVLLSRDPPSENPSSTINALASRFDFEIHIIGSGGRVRQNFVEITSAFRASLPRWEEAGKLKFWVTD